MYDWDALRNSGHAWWISRLRSLLANVDVCRLDHFRDFAAAWHAPAGSSSAQTDAFHRHLREVARAYEKLEPFEDEQRHAHRKRAGNCRADLSATSTSTALWPLRIARLELGSWCGGKRGETMLAYDTAKRLAAAKDHFAGRSGLPGQASLSDALRIG